jgi:hypothetical protein
MIAGGLVTESAFPPGWDQKATYSGTLFIIVESNRQFEI